MVFRGCNGKAVVDRHVTPNIPASVPVSRNNPAAGRDNRAENLPWGKSYPDDSARQTAAGPNSGSTRQRAHAGARVGAPTPTFKADTRSIARLAHRSNRSSPRLSNSAASRRCTTMRGSGSAQMTRGCFSVPASFQPAEAGSGLPEKGNKMPWLELLASLATIRKRTLGSTAQEIHDLAQRGARWVPSQWCAKTYHQKTPATEVPHECGGRLVRNQLHAITPCHTAQCTDPPGPGKAASHTSGSQQRSALADGAKEEVPRSELKALRQPCVYRESQEFTGNTAETVASFLINLGSPSCGSR